MGGIDEAPPPVAAEDAPPLFGVPLLPATPFPATPVPEAPPVLVGDPPDALASGEVTGAHVCVSAQSESPAQDTAAQPSSAESPRAKRPPKANAAPRAADLNRQYIANSSPVLAEPSRLPYSSPSAR
jgi:hypothetical protein